MKTFFSQWLVLFPYSNIFLILGDEDKSSPGILNIYLHPSLPQSLGFKVNLEKFEPILKLSSSPL